MDFNIYNYGTISNLFRARNIATFQGAVAMVRSMPYGRNTDKEDLTIVFKDGCGTCSTKHALIKQLAAEHNADNVILKLCIFKMNCQNTGSIAPVLDHYGLDYMPEAHNYLLVDGIITDCTKPNFSIANFAHDIIQEIDIQPSQITDFKVAYHKAFLQDLLLANSNIKYTLDELYAIREECIAALAG